MEISIKTIKVESKKVVVLSYVNVSITSITYKKELEEKLKEYVIQKIFPDTPFSIYSSIENDRASITVIVSLDSFDGVTINLK